MTTLSAKKCAVCRSDTPTLSSAQIAEHLELVEGWQIKDSAIERRFIFKDFKGAKLFFDLVAGIAEREAHHPDMSIVKCREVHLVLTTYAAHGLTENDFILAAKIDRLARSYS